jgi:hypothetical protein
MESIVIIEVLVSAAVTIAAGAVLGFLSHQLTGVFIIVVGLGLACGITAVGLGAGDQVAGARDAGMGPELYWPSSSLRWMGRLSRCRPASFSRLRPSRPLTP